MILTDNKIAALGEYAELMTISEVAEVLGIKPTSVYAKVSIGKLRRRFDCKRGFHPEDVKAYIESKQRLIPDELCYDIDEQTGCWNWRLACDKDGYGAKKLNDKSLKAHRYFYEKYKNKIPDGLQIDHLCRNRKCVNPDHLEPVTGRENTRRGANRYKLDASDVEEMRRLFKEGMSRQELADKYKIHKSYCDQIIRGAAWKI